MLKYATGNDYVDKMSVINLTGNIIPQIWYKTIVRDNGKPHLLAISILADIVYWYRPAEIRDQSTGAFKGYAKKFSGDFLQRSYGQLAEQFGESKRSVTDAVVRLEKLGVIERIFRTIEIGGVLYNNVLYLKLNPEKIMEITYPENKKEEEIREQETIEEYSYGIHEIRTEKSNKCKNESRVSDATSHEEIGENLIRERMRAQEEYSINNLISNSVTPVPKFCDRGHIISGEVSQNLGRQNTKNTTENNNIISSSSFTDTYRDDDDLELRGRVGLEKAKTYCSPVLVERIFREVKEQPEISGRMNDVLFLKLCMNVEEYSSGISNMKGYVKKCIDNLMEASQFIKAQPTGRMSEAGRKKHKNQFCNFRQNEYDFEELEKDLLSIHET